MVMVHLLKSARRLGVPAAVLLIAVSSAQAKGPWIELFSGDEPTKGWIVTDWSDLEKPPPDEARWEVVDRVLLGSTPRGTWLG
jgi:hypothetical protein